MRQWLTALSLLAFALLACMRAHAQTEPPPPPGVVVDRVTFAAGGRTLFATVARPAGKGPFGVVMYNHGSERTPGVAPDLRNFWTSHGYVFFMPHRHGQGKSPGDYIVDLQQKFDATHPNANARAVYGLSLHELYNFDVEAAVRWIKAQPFVDPKRVFMTGCSYGGIQTLLSAEKGMGVCAFAAFAPGAMSWKSGPVLQSRLLQAVRDAKAPLMVLQAQNDYDLGPSSAMSSFLKEKGPPSHAKVYPVFGDPANHADGHGGFAERGSSVWGADVIAFFHQAESKNPK